MMTPSEYCAVVGTIDPDAYTAASYETDEIDISEFHRYFFIVSVGDLGSSATIDFKLQGANALGGSYADLSGLAITQLTQAGSDDNKQVWLEVSPIKLKELDADVTHIKGVLTVGTATSDAAVIAHGMCPRYGLAFDFDLASVDEIVTKVN